MAKKIKKTKSSVILDKAVKTRAYVALRHSKQPLPPDGVKIRVEQQIAKIQRLSNAQNNGKSHSSTEHLKAQKDILLSSYYRTSKRTNKPILSVLIFKGYEFIQASSGWNPIFLSNSEPALRIKKQNFSLLSTNEYVLIDCQNPSPLKATKHTCVNIDNVKLKLAKNGYPSVQELLKLDINENTRAVLKFISAPSCDTIKKSIKQTRTKDMGLTIAARVSLLLPTLPLKKFSDLRQLWLNALRIKDDTPLHNLPSLMQLIEKIELEWSRRGAVGEIENEEFFKWPSTDATSNKSLSAAFEVPDYGLLSYLEYHVGRTNGQPLKVRHSILDRVFSGLLPPVFIKNYMIQWGAPETSKRLQKMAETLAALARNFKRRDDDRFDQAIREWETDLFYLYEKYYIGKFHFIWPSLKTKND